MERPAPTNSSTQGGKGGRGRSGGKGAGVGGGRGGYPRAVEGLIEAFSSLPGIGRRSAERLALHVLKSPVDEAMVLANAIGQVKTSVVHCSICYGLADGDPCEICVDDRRDRGQVLVVEQPRDMIALEATGMYRGLYHVLMGRISPLEGIGPDDVTIQGLLDRVGEPEKNAGGERVREVILGLNPTVEGDGTAMYLAERLKGLGNQGGEGVGVSRLARGLPTGWQLEYANKAVLADALEGRRSMGGMDDV